jgi:hypothetical protein
VKGLLVAILFAWPIPSFAAEKIPAFLVGSWSDGHGYLLFLDADGNYVQTTTVGGLMALKKATYDASKLTLQAYHGSREPFRYNPRTKTLKGNDQGWFEKWSRVNSRVPEVRGMCEGKTKRRDSR